MSDAVQAKDDTGVEIFCDMKKLHDMMGAPGDGTVMDARFLAFRLRFLFEELLEIVEAAEAGIPEDVVDGLVDTIVIAAGTLYLAGVDGRKAWHEVQRANMAKKLGAVTGRTGSGGLDLVKPPGWIGPSHAGNVGFLDNAVGYDLRDQWSNSVTALLQAGRMQFKKNADYDSEASGIRRADYFPRGVDDLFYEINKKHLRFKSVLERLRAGEEPDNENLEESMLDRINYESFAVALLRFRLEGQDAGKDIFGDDKS